MAASSRFAVGIHVLVYLAHQGKTPASSAEIASSVNTHPVVLRRLLASFVKARLVEPRKGAAGGFSLVKPPEKLSLLTVYRAVENAPALGRAANSPSRDCPIGAGIAKVINRVCGQAQIALEKELARTTLAQAYEATCEEAEKSPAGKRAKREKTRARAKV